MSALERFKEFGITFSKPAGEPVQLPSDITLLSSEQLAEAFTKLTAWADYANSEHAMAVIEERNALRNLELTQDRMLITRFGAVKGERITFVKTQISVDDKVVALRELHDEKYAYRKMVEMILQNTERDIALVSREITRRGSDQRAMRRDWGTT